MKDNQRIWLVIFADGSVLKKDGKVVAFLTKSTAEMARLVNGADHLICF